MVDAKWKLLNYAKQWRVPDSGRTVHVRSLQGTKIAITSTKHMLRRNWLRRRRRHLSSVRFCRIGIICLGLHYRDVYSKTIQVTNVHDGNLKLGMHKEHRERTKLWNEGSKWLVEEKKIAWRKHTKTKSLICRERCRKQKNLVNETLKKAQRKRRQFWEEITETYKISNRKYWTTLKRLKWNKGWKEIKAIKIKTNNINWHEDPVDLEKFYIGIFHVLFR